MLFALFLARIAAGLKTLDGAADALDALFDMMFFGEAKAQAKMLLAAAVHVKGLANHESHPLARHLAQQRARPQVPRQTTPEVKPARRLVDAHLARPVRGYSPEHQVAFTPVDLAQHGQVIVQQVTSDDF